MSSHHEHPMPVRGEFFTNGTKVIFFLMLVGLSVTLYRFIAGLGAVTNLNNGYGWGIWIAIDVACGVALAAGGFMTALIAEIFHKEKYHVLTRPALLTAMLGYTFVAIGVMTDLGRWYNIWHPMIPSMWQGNSALFEVGICVMSYVTVLYIEFLPIVVEHFKAKFKASPPVTSFTRLISTVLNIADKTLGKVIKLFIIAGVVLSCMHQSSLGTLMVLAPTKMHPLWYTNVLPLLFLLSAFAVGFPMVIFESLIASRSFKLQPETKILGKLARYTPVLLMVYLAVKVIDMTLRNAWGYVFEFSMESWFWLAEVIIGCVVPIVLLSFAKYRYKPLTLFLSASAVILGVALNRINVFLIAYTPLYYEGTYFPSFTEIMVTVGFICTLVILYRVIVMYLPVISQPDTDSPDAIVNQLKNTQVTQ
ncbi:MAG: Ni/Fe-hydrogenase cytochrome b subunit [Calditrichaeota bacterium]|nr:MAG: Ni/Fe-hydrogenase cytochrome b subunit [Calditrichota bacterium]